MDAIAHARKLLFKFASGMVEKEMINLDNSYQLF